MLNAKAFLTKKFMLALSIIALSVLIIWQLKTVTYSKDSAPAQVETTYGPIRLTMRLEKTTYRLGEPVNITLTVTNVGNETVLLGFSVFCKTNFVVCNKSYQTIFDYFTSVGWLGIGGEVVLDPRESLSQTLTWDQLEIDNFPPFAFRHVQPGIYYIKGQIGPCLHYVGSPEEYDPLKCTDFIKIETPKIEIEICTHAHTAGTARYSVIIDNSLGKEHIQTLRTDQYDDYPKKCWRRERDDDLLI